MLEQTIKGEIMKIITATYTCSCGYKTNWTTLALLHKFITWVSSSGREHSIDQKISEMEK